MSASHSTRSPSWSRSAETRVAPSTATGAPVRTVTAGPPGNGRRMPSGATTWTRSAPAWSSAPAARAAQSPPPTTTGRRPARSPVSDRWQATVAARIPAGRGPASPSSARPSGRDPAATTSARAGIRRAPSWPITSSSSPSQRIAVSPRCRIAPRASAAAAAARVSSLSQPCTPPGTGTRSTTTGRIPSGSDLAQARPVSPAPTMATVSGIGRPNADRRRRLGLRQQPRRQSRRAASTGTRRRPCRPRPGSGRRWPGCACAGHRPTAAAAPSQRRRRSRRPSPARRRRRPGRSGGRWRRAPPDAGGGAGAGPARAQPAPAGARRAPARRPPRAGRARARRSPAIRRPPSSGCRPRGSGLAAAGRRSSRYVVSEAGRLAAKVLIAYSRRTAGTSRPAASRTCSRTSRLTARSAGSSRSSAVGPRSSERLVVGTQ